MKEAKARGPKLTWKPGAYSSVVGTSVVAYDESGAVFALLPVSIPRPSMDYKSNAVPLAERAAAALNHFDAYGLALLMIAEGVGDPTEVARRALRKAGVISPSPSRGE